MSDTRFMFVLGHQVDGRMSPQWPGIGRQPSPDEVPDAWVAWRLLGSNHREVARSASVFADISSCSDQIRRMQEALRAEAVEFRTEPFAGQWSWVMLIEGEPGAVSSRPYQRQRECDYNCEVFAGSAPTARLVAAGIPDEPTLPSAAAG
jgi:hypothetical protein